MHNFCLANKFNFCIKDLDLGLYYLNDFNLFQRYFNLPFWHLDKDTKNMLKTAKLLNNNILKLKNKKNQKKLLYF